jgi:hypothetical protein
MKEKSGFLGFPVQFFKWEFSRIFSRLIIYVPVQFFEWELNVREKQIWKSEFVQQYQWKALA